MNDTIPLDITPPEPEDTRPRRSLRPILVGAGAGLAVLALGVGGFALADALGDGSDDRIVVTSSPNGSPTDDSPPSGGSSPSPSGSPSDDSDDRITSERYDEVTAAALAAVGGGTVIEVDQGDDPGEEAWKVEIRLANGDEAEVRLAADLTVLRVDLDNDDGHGGDDNGGDRGGHGSDD